MPAPLIGLHHVTAICGDAQRNHDFYTGVLGLRLVKQTVNFDDPNSWHLYYGDTTGQPGTLMTFFAWPDGEGGQVGLDQFGSVLLGIPAKSLGFWIERLLGLGIAYQQPGRRFGERSIAFRDPDGLNLELVTLPDPPPCDPWEDSPVPVEHAIRGIHGVSLWANGDAAATFFSERLGFRDGGRESTTHRLLVGQGERTGVLDLVGATGLWPGSVAVGTIHHVAWAVADDEELTAWQAELGAHDIDVTPIRDRTYFHSIYMETPGGAMVEMATSGPGFTVDEDAASLGQRLQLPPQLERQRLGLEGSLPPLDTTLRQQRTS